MSEANQAPGARDQFVLENESDRSRTPIGEAVRVGRDPSCELVLASEKSSRVHARLAVDGGTLWVEDQKSTNGTYVNKQKIDKSTPLNDGDIVQFGDVRFRVIGPPEPEAIEGTVMIGQQTMLHALEDEEKAQAPKEEADAPEKAPAASKKKPSAAAEKREAKADAKPAGPQGKEKPAPRADAKVSGADEPKRPGAGGGAPAGSGEGGARAIEGRTGGDPSIPRSWADADQLEQASHTAFVVRSGKSENGGAKGLNPAKAVKEARQSIPAEVAILVGLTAPIEGTPFKLSRKGGTEKWEMGRGEGADISIEDESVSGRHAQLICENGRWKVVNMMSVNGTFVNERKVLSAYLSPHDVIRMGSVELVFDAKTEKRRPERQAERPGSGRAAATGSFMESAMRGLRSLAESIAALFRKR